MKITNDITISGGVHIIDATWEIENCRVVASPSARFLPSRSDIDMIRMKPGGRWTGGYFDCHESDYTGTVFSINSEDMVATLTQCAVNDVTLHASTAYSHGTGLKLFSNTAGPSKCSYNFFDNLTIYGFERGIYLEQLGAGWISGNIFTGVNINACVYAIDIFTDAAATAAAKCSGNSFTNLQLQPGVKTQDLIRIQNSDMNQFVNAICWDPQKAIGKSVNIVSGRYNQISGYIDSKYIYDSGYGNFIAVTNR